MNIYSLIAFSTVATLIVECKPTGLSVSGRNFPPSDKPTIIGGQDAYDGQFPYMLELEYYGTVGWKHVCGAVVLSEYYALTAAKCVNNINTINIRLYAGLLVRENYTLTNAQQLSVNLITVHENYSDYMDGTPNDVAVLRFAWPVDLARPNVAVATLPSDDGSDYSGTVATIIGWGRYSLDQVFAWTLQWAYNDIITNDGCRQYMIGISNAVVSDESHVCVMSSPPGIGACSGDSGSPLLVGPDESPIVVGLASWTVMQNGYCNENFPTVYTRISKFLHWIATYTPPYP